MSPPDHHHDHDAEVVRVAILTISDTRRRGDDASGDAVARLLTDAGHAVTARQWVPDDVVSIQAAGLRLLDEADVLVTTGGTGLAPRDVTPEAFDELFEKRLPGFGERFRAISVDQAGELAALSRATAGLVRREGGLKPVVILPGAPRAVELAVGRLLVPLLPHLVGLTHALEHS
jgi:molybdenum cofactor biosynthesis protein B